MDKDINKEKDIKMKVAKLVKISMDMLKLLSENGIRIDDYKYIIVKRFIKCNFSKLDNTYIDIDKSSKSDFMHFEKVDCPLRGECPYEGIICMPCFSSSLTEREKRIAKLWHDGFSKNDIAERLFLSIETINNHIRRIYAKLGVHTVREFVQYIDKNHII